MVLGAVAKSKGQLKVNTGHVTRTPMNCRLREHMITNSVTLSSGCPPIGSSDLVQMIPKGFQYIHVHRR
jgi:hypothetical protein